MRIPASRATVVRPVACLKAGAKRVASVAGATIASLALALSANAVNIKLGSDTGALVFDPATVTVKPSEPINFINNAGYPHNIVFDEDDVPVSNTYFLD